MNTQILLMDADKLRFLLTNHKYFSVDEIQLSAKRLIKLNKTSCMQQRFDNRLSVFNDLAAYQRGNIGQQGLYGGLYR